MIPEQVVEQKLELIKKAFPQAILNSRSVDGMLEAILTIGGWKIKITDTGPTGIGGANVYYVLSDRDVFVWGTGAIYLPVEESIRYLKDWLRYTSGCLHSLSDSVEEEKDGRV